MTAILLVVAVILLIPSALLLALGWWRCSLRLDATGHLLDTAECRAHAEADTVTVLLKANYQQTLELRGYEVCIAMAWRQNNRVSARNAALSRDVTSLRHKNDQLGAAFRALIPVADGEVLDRLRFADILADQPAEFFLPTPPTQRTGEVND